ncbi:MAG: CPBP family intramembrane metalloprotease [Candidatus Iainarchaeum archaeon]|uniref:CPBP family intramembrane metalloprotease n=1 Tax=Candidatus Iainarchaeum sp. TaxID=3101447 RepID=A0A7T9DK72_9ARCH|nr:MAG: CPBP family intramembrane metalloprotease [Candidatus Diapherotrites archaeon]
MENQIYGLSAAAWFIPLLFLSISLIWAHFQKKEKQFFGKIPSFSREQLILVGQTLLFLLVVGIVIDRVAVLLQFNDTQAVTATAAFFASIPLTAIVFFVFGALAEEMFFRGVLFHEIGKWPSIVLFALAHGGYFSIVEVIGALAAGYVLVRTRERAASIFPGFVAHALYNLVAVFILIWVT